MKRSRLPNGYRSGKITIPTMNRRNFFAELTRRNVIRGINPFLDALRGDPRFEALAEKIVPAREFAKALPAAK